MRVKPDSLNISQPTHAGMIRIVIKVRKLANTDDVYGLKSSKYGHNTQQDTLCYASHQSRSATLGRLTPVVTVTKC